MRCEDGECVDTELTLEGPELPDSNRNVRCAIQFRALQDVTLVSTGLVFAGGRGGAGVGGRGKRMRVHLLDVARNESIWSDDEVYYLPGGPAEIRLRPNIALTAGRTYRWYLLTKDLYAADFAAYPVANAHLSVDSGWEAFATTRTTWYGFRNLHTVER